MDDNQLVVSFNVNMSLSEINEINLVPSVNFILKKLMNLC